MDISPSHGLKFHSESQESQLGRVKRRSGDVLKMKIPQKCQDGAGTKGSLIYGASIYVQIPAQLQTSCIYQSGIPNQLPLSPYK